jgi:hypothetical protein
MRILVASAASANGVGIFLAVALYGRPLGAFSSYRAGTAAKSEPRPSAIVGCVKMASRSLV